MILVPGDCAPRSRSRVEGSDTQITSIILTPAAHRLQSWPRQRTQTPGIFVSKPQIPMCVCVCVCVCVFVRVRACLREKRLRLNGQKDTLRLLVAPPFDLVHCEKFWVLDISEMMDLRWWLPGYAIYDANADKVIELNIDTADVPRKERLQKRSFCNEFSTGDCDHPFAGGVKTFSHGCVTHLRCSSLRTQTWLLGSKITSIMIHSLPACLTTQESCQKFAHISQTNVQLEATTTGPSR